MRQKKIGFVFKSQANIVGKGENTGYPTFSPFTMKLSTAFLPVLY